MEVPKSLELRRVSSSADLASPGDFVYIAKREPLKTVLMVPIDPPRGFFKRIVWNIAGKKFAVREELDPRWPEQDTIVLLCPHCSQPLATTKEHKIVSLDSLTLNKPLACPYSRSRGISAQADVSTEVSFEIVEGKIMTA
jgi:hypothetical protein